MLKALFFLIVFVPFNSISGVTPEQKKIEDICLAALRAHPRLKFSDLSPNQIQQLDDMFYGVSHTQMVVFVLKQGPIISENCSKEVTNRFIGKFDSSFIWDVKTSAGQGGCTPGPDCNARRAKYEQMARDLSGGNAGVASANARDTRYTSASPAGFDNGTYGVCCKSDSGTHNTNDTSAGGACGDVVETILPCVPYSGEPLKETDPDFGAFLKKHKPNLFDKWYEKNKNRLVARPRAVPVAPAGAPPARPAAQDGRR